MYFNLHGLNLRGGGGGKLYIDYIFCMPFCCLLFFFKINFFKNLIGDYYFFLLPSECHAGWLQIKLDILPDLGKTVCKGYQQMILRVVGKKLKYHPKVFRQFEITFIWGPNKT